MPAKGVDTQATTKATGVARPSTLQAKKPGVGALSKATKPADNKAKEENKNDAPPKSARGENTAPVSARARPATGAGIKPKVESKVTKDLKSK